MDTKALERFAQAARRQLHQQVGARLEQALSTDSADLRARAAAVRELKEQVAASSREAVVERVAYTWFNRFCALRFMDANHYTRLGVVSPAAGFTQPELLQEAKGGLIDDELAPFLDRRRVFDLLAGRAPSPDPQQEAYRLLLAAACNAWHQAMPFLFERIDDYTELLMPEDLLSAGAVLHGVREAMTAEACQDVEVIGWLYQFYIAEKKEEVDARVKKGGKVAPDELPAKTSLYTPHWIVRFLVENSLGRLWLLNRPGSKLAERMAYLIRPEETESDFLRVASPEELRVCDPAAGSGHMLAYAFDLLYAIYEEEGYSAADIPRLILENNLYGIEIDERAGALAAFALAMKARDKDKRFFRRGVRPQICVLRPLAFTDEELKAEPWIAGSRPLRAALLHDLALFREADNFGSLLRPQLGEEQIAALRLRIAAETPPRQEDWLRQERRQRLERALEQAEYLGRQYHIVVANPPYLGGSMNERLNEFARENYPDSKADLFAMFIERSLELAASHGLVAMITMQGWMFLSSYEKLRHNLLERKTILCMAHLGPRAFDTIGGEVVSATSFVIRNRTDSEYSGYFLRLINGSNESDKNIKLLSLVSQGSSAARMDSFRVSAKDLRKIPGIPIAYWVKDKVRDLFKANKVISNFGNPRQGLASTNNALFYRLWFEVSKNRTGFSIKTRQDAAQSGKKWFPLNKGGSFRRWAGNFEYVINFERDGKAICDYIDSTPGARVGSNGRVINRDFYFQSGVTYSDLTTGLFGARGFSSGFIFDTTGPSIFDEHGNGIDVLLAYLNTNLFQLILDTVCTGMHYSNGVLSGLPALLPNDAFSTKRIIDISRTLTSLLWQDWNAFETSWDFSYLALLDADFKQSDLATTYDRLRMQWRAISLEVQRLEEENNRIFIEANSLQDELTPDVPLHEITLTCNPPYRYGPGKSEAEYEALLLADTMSEFVSYAVGCMFGRYSLDQPGLILANQGETLADYLQQVPAPTFTPDQDNAIPILDGDWFEDDIAGRFKRFLRVAFGEERYAENLSFVEAALGRDIRSYFLRQFYDDHVRRYKNRPIYWLFSSPKGSFNVLIYMHRYRPDTVSVVLNDYLREFRARLASRKAHLQRVAAGAAASAREKTAALKESERLDRVLHELAAYEDEVLYPLATRRLEIDLDDGVKVNYARFGTALRPIKGLN